MYTIPPAVRRIRIEPSIMDYSLSDPLVHVELEGANDSGITSRRSVDTALEYTNLNYGSYKLHIQILDNETIDGFRGELDNYTEEGLEKELAFVLVQSKPAIFTTEEKVPNFVPKDDSHNGGIEEILSRYKK